MKLIKYCVLSIGLIATSVFASTHIESVQKYYSQTSESFEKYDWPKVIEYGSEIIRNYPNSPFAKDTLFYLGVAYFNLRDFDTSNKNFTKYLKDDFNPKYFEETMQYKYEIAQNFKNGAKKRLFGMQKGPKIMPAKEDSLTIYDEIIASMPLNDIAAKSLFAKGQLLCDFEEYKDSISTFEKVIERFEKTELAVDSFIEIGKVYLKQTTYKHQDSDLLELAEMNLEKMKKLYSSDTKKIAQLEKIVLEMKEKFAEGFLETANFYEKTHKKEAALIYYTKIINGFSQTNASKIAQKRFDKLNAK